MIPKIDFDDGFPEGLRDETSTLLTPFLPLVGDLEVLRVGIKSSNDDVPPGEAAIAVSRRYHVAYLWVDPAFFALDDDEKRQTLLHELVHVRLDVFSREVMSLVRHWVPEGVSEYVEERLEDSEEEATDALAHAIWRLLTWTTRAHRLDEEKLTRMPFAAEEAKNAEEA